MINKISILELIFLILLLMRGYENVGILIDVLIERLEVWCIYCKSRVIGKLIKFGSYEFFRVFSDVRWMSVLRKFAF